MAALQLAESVLTFASIEGFLCDMPEYSESKVEFWGDSKGESMNQQLRAFLRSQLRPHNLFLMKVRWLSFLCQHLTYKDMLELNE